VRVLKCVLLLALIPTVSHAQYGSHERSDPIGRASTSEPVNNFVVHGSVVLPSGMAPGRLVAVERVCAGRPRDGTYADAKGRFSFYLGVLDRLKAKASASDLRTCSLQASLDGYHPHLITLESLVKSANENLGKLVLQPTGSQPSAVISATDMEVPKNARKNYDEGLNAAAKTKWAAAISAMEKATAADPKFATAWLSLGTLQNAQGDIDAALDSYAQSIAADDKFGPAYVELAALQVETGHWSHAAESAGKAIALDPDAFPRAYYLAAIADSRLNRLDAAEKDIAAGLRVDPNHEFPDLEYLDGIMRLSKGDVLRGKEQLESYLSHAPDGANAAGARQRLGQPPESK
jgi:tetratricopeptide (TPR) repeat protein